MMEKEKVLDEMKFLLEDDTRILTYKFVSQNFSVHVNTAKEYLQHLYETMTKSGDDSVCALYFLCGNTCNEAQEASMKVMLVSGGSLDKTRARLLSVTSCHIYSLQRQKPRNYSAVYAADLQERLLESPPEGSLCAIKSSIGVRDTKATVSSVDKVPCNGSVKQPVKRELVDNRGEKATNDRNNNNNNKDNSRNNNNNNKDNSRNSNNNNKDNSRNNNNNNKDNSRNNNNNNKDNSKNNKDNNSKNNSSGGVKSATNNDNKKSSIASMFSNARANASAKSSSASSSSTVTVKTEQCDSSSTPTESTTTDKVLKSGGRDRKKKSAQNGRQKVSAADGDGEVSFGRTGVSAGGKRGASKATNSGRSAAKVTQNKRRRILAIESDSSDESDSERSDGGAECDQESEDVEQVLSSPAKSTSHLHEDTGLSGGQRNRRRKLVDKTFIDSEGFMVTKKVYESASDSDEQTEGVDGSSGGTGDKASDQAPPNAAIKSTAGDSETSGSKLPATSGGQKTKQANIMNFFKKK